MGYTEVPYLDLSECSQKNTKVVSTNHNQNTNLQASQMYYCSWHKVNSKAT